MKHLNNFKFKRWEDRVKGFCNQYGINYEIDEESIYDGDPAINSSSNIDLRNYDFEKIPIKFNRVDGDFYCTKSSVYGKPEFKGLKTLENSPRYVSGIFNCSGNQLETLIGGPEYVGRKYFCQDNNLKDIYGLPRNFDQHLWIAPLSPQKNPVYEIIKLVEHKKLIKMGIVKSYKEGTAIERRFNRLLNEYQVIRNGDTIIKDRLQEAIYGSGVNKKIEELRKTNFRFYKMIGN